MDEYRFDRRSWLKGDSFLQTSSWFMPTAFFNTVKFDATSPHDDWDFLLRATYQFKAKIVTVTEPLTIFHTEEPRQSLSNLGRLRASCIWVENLRGIVGRRASSGFYLTMLGGQAAVAKDGRGFFTLLWKAFRHGSPTLMQLMVFFGYWLSPLNMRRWLS
jgi:hypothetical protein